MNEPIEVNDPFGNEPPASSPVTQSELLPVAPVKAATVVPVKAVPAVPDGELNIDGLIRHAMDTKVDVVAFKGLFEMAKEMQAMAATRSYSKAFANFKATCPKIVQRHESDQHKKIVKGKQVNRPYAGLSDICRVIEGPLTDNGMSYNWGDAVVDGGMMTVTCRVSHVDGGSRTSSATFPVDSQAGSSPQQKYGATLTYARRASIVSVLGLWSVEPDDDCDPSPVQEETDSGEPLSCAQVAELEELLDRCPEGTEGRLLKTFGVQGLYQLRPMDFGNCKSKLRATIKKAEEVGQ